MKSPPSAQRLCTALAHQVGLEPASFDSAGTTVCYRDDRVNTGQAAVYRVGVHTVLWADPALAGQLDVFHHDSVAADLDQVISALLSGGFVVLGGGFMRTQDALAEKAMSEWVAEGTYRSTWLSDSDPDDLAAIAKFASQCSEPDLEAVDMEDLDEFEGDPVHGVVDTDGSLAALAYGTPWDWDDAFVDVGVIVSPEHRRRGLGVQAIAGLGAQILSRGNTPLYRHEADNTASAGVAARLGFEEVLSLRVLRAQSAA